MNRKGKITLGTLIGTIIVIYLAFMLFKVIENGYTKEEIKNEVHNQIGMRRSTKLTLQNIEDQIVKVLKKKDVIFTNEHEVRAMFSKDGQKIIYTYEYEKDINFLLFRTNPKLIKIRDEIDRYGL